MAGLISDIVGGNVDSDLDKLVAKLAVVEKELDVINGKAISIKVDLQGVGTLSELTNLYKQQDDILTKLRSTSVQYVDTYKMATDAIAKHNGQTQKVVAVSDKIAATLLKEAKAREVNARAADKEAALSEKVSRQKEKGTQSVEKAAAAKQKAAEREIADYNRGAAAADKAAAAKQREIDKEIANYNKGAQAAQRHAEMTANQRERAEKTSQKYQAELRKETQAIADKLAKETAALQIADNAYIVLRNEYNKQSTALKGMIIQYGEADAAVLKMKADVDKMQLSLLKAEEAVGQHQRKVGNYNNLSNSFSQIIRETPAFAYSFSTGIMGISNNIPPLLDDLKRLKQANKEAAEAGGEQKTTWDSLKESLFSVNGLITIGVGLFTILAARWDNATESMSDADIAAQELADTISDLNNIVSKGYVQELTETNDLFRVSSDLGLSYDIRVKAIEDLMNLYPGLLSNLENEAFLTGNVAEQQDLIAKVISKKNYVKYYEGIAEEMEKQKSILQKKFDDNNAPGWMGLYNPFSTKGTSEDMSNQERAIEKLQADIDDAKKMKQILQDELKYIMNPKHEGRILVDIDADIREQQRKRDNNAADKKEHIEAIARIKELEEERRKFLGSDKQKKEKKDTISDDLAAAKSDYELQLMLNQQKFANSRKTYFEEQQLNEDNLKATEDYGDKFTKIVEKFNKKHLLTENEHIKLINDANKILLEGQIKAKEAGDKIEEDILKKKIQTNNEMLKYIEGLSKQRQELEKINREIDNIQDKAASRKEYAESFAPFLEGFGFNTAFGQQVKQKNIDIEGQRDKVDLAREEWANEGAKGSKGNPLELLKLQTKAQQEKKNLDQMESEREEMYNQKMIEGKKRVAQATIDFATTAINEIQAKQEDSYKRQIAYIDEMQRKAIINSQLEIQSIQGRTAYQIEKENEIAKVTAQARSQEAAFEAEKRSISIAQAKFTRQNAIATAILNGAVGVTKIWSEYSGNPIVAAALTALQAGVIASQIQRAQSAPVPMYAKGTSDHKGGLAVIGDGGEPEFVSTPTGKSFWSKSTSTLIDLPKHSTVTPLSKMQQFAANGVGLSLQTISELNNTRETLNDKRIVEKLEDIHEAFISNMMRGRTNVNVSIKSTTNRRIYNQQ